MKLAVVTGTSRGLGRAVALRLAEEGYHLVLMGRRSRALEEIDDAVTQRGATATLVPLDFTKADAEFDQLGAHLYERFGKLNLFVNCAAHLGTLGPVAHMDAGNWATCLAVNATAPFRLLRSFDPLFRAARAQGEAAKAAFVIGDLGTHDAAFWGAFRASRRALAEMLDAYRAEVAHTGVEVQTLDPGVFAGEIYKQAYPGREPATLPSVDEAASRVIAQLGLASAVAA